MPGCHPLFRPLALSQPAILAILYPLYSTMYSQCPYYPGCLLASSSAHAGQVWLQAMRCWPFIVAGMVMASLRLVLLQLEWILQLAWSWCPLPWSPPGVDARCRCHAHNILAQYGTSTEVLHSHSRQAEGTVPPYTPPQVIDSSNSTCTHYSYSYSAPTAKRIPTNASESDQLVSLPPSDPIGSYHSAKSLIPVTSPSGRFDAVDASLSTGRCWTWGGSVTVTPEAQASKLRLFRKPSTVVSGQSCRCRVQLHQSFVQKRRKRER